LLNLRKHSNQVELDQFFKTIYNENHASQHITKSAFFQARQQLSHTAFIDLNHQLIHDIYESNSRFKTWKGFRLCAIDGTSIRLPNEPDLTNYFGIQKGRSDQVHCTMAMASVFYDVLNHQVIDSSINPNLTSERNCAAKHLAWAGESDLILYDRGYPAFWFFSHHIKNKLTFCMRVKTRQDLPIKAFLDSGKKEAIITLEPNRYAINTCKQRGLSSVPIRLRLVRVDLSNEVEVLITNLFDRKKYNVGVFKSLYHLRWGVEENYKRLKQWVEIENFSGKSALSVKQDFYAKIVAMNLTALMAMAAKTTTSKKFAHRTLQYQINFAQALSKMKHRMVWLILQAHSDILRLIEQTLDYISMTIEPIRGGRSTPRQVRNAKNDIHFQAYKSSL